MKKQAHWNILFAILAVFATIDNLKAQCTANFNYEFYTFSCDIVFFEDLSVCSSGYNIITWNWDFGDGFTSDLQNPFHQYITSDTYDVQLSISADSNGYIVSNNVTHQLSTLIPPSISFTWSPEPTLLGNPTHFYGTSNDTITDWYWDFDDGFSTTTQNPIHIFNSYGTYNVLLIGYDINGCQDTVVHNITIGIVPALDFTWNYSYEEEPVEFTVLSPPTDIPAVTSWNWDFGDEGISNEMEPTHVFVVAGTYDVSLTIIDTMASTNTVVKQIHIYPPPIFPDSNSIWNIVGNNSLTSENWRYRFGLIGDTTISYTKDTSYAYSKVYNLDDSTLSSDNAIYFGAIRTTDDNKVYLKLPELPETILYDYSLEVGDTVWFDIGGFATSNDVFFEEQNHYKVVTNKDSTLLLDNNYHTRWFLQGELMEDIWIEGVGSISWFGLFNPIISDITTNGDSFSFACFKQNEIPLYIDNPECDRCFCYLLTEVNELNINSSDEIEIYPNPTDNIINISTINAICNKIGLQIFNSKGSIVYHAKNHSSNSIIIKVNNWNKGLYLVTIYCEDELINTGKFVIK